MSTIYPFLIFFAAIILSYALTPTFIDMFEQCGRLTKNYKNEMIPQGTGIVFSLYFMLWYIIYVLLAGCCTLDTFLIQFAVISACFVGFIDDTLGSRNVLGLKGHFKSLFKGRLTTGALKAIVGLLVAYVISFSLATQPLDIVIHTLIMALFTNFFNLLDLRPGRAIKAYITAFLMILVSVIIAGNTAIILPFIPLAGSIIGYMPYDLKAKCMMGDAGSNVLGISIGFLVVLTFSIFTKILVLVFLVGIHIFTEKYSLTNIIKKNRFLNYLDELGRS